MSKSRLIIVDFDHTVFNTTLFVEFLQKDFKDSFGISDEVFVQHRDLIKKQHGIIDVDKFVDSFTDADSNDLHGSVYKTIKLHAKECIFADTLDFFKKNKEKCDILIATHGDDELQTEKIQHSELPEYIQHVISLEPKDVVIPPYVDQYDNVFFIDDKSTNIDAVKQRFSKVTTYHIRRPYDMPYGKIKSACDCADYEIEDLDLILF